VHKVDFPMFSMPASASADTWTYRAMSSHWRDANHYNRPAKINPSDPSHKPNFELL
jgi:hypothetical protein